MLRGMDRRSLLACVALAPLALTLPGRALARDTRAEARALEGRLLAPCCWQQTLDIHESPLSSALRGEIEERLAGGESAASLEADMVARFGPRVRALPTEEALSASMIVAAGAGLAAAGALAFSVRRWLRRGREGAASPPPAAGRDAYDDRLDDALAELDRG